MAGGLYSLGFLSLVAHAGALAAPGAAPPVLGLHGSFQIDADDVGQRRQPGEDVGELLLALQRRPAPQRRGQFADFLHEPHERPLDAATPVLDVIGVADDLLELPEGNRHRLLERLLWSAAS